MSRRAHAKTGTPLKLIVRGKALDAEVAALPFVPHSTNAERIHMTTWYTSEHEWIRVEGDVGTVGITAFAAEKLGDVVFVELPDVGKKREEGRRHGRGRVGEGRFRRLSRLSPAK